MTDQAVAGEGPNEAGGASAAGNTDASVFAVLISLCPGCTKRKSCDTSGRIICVPSITCLDFEAAPDPEMQMTPAQIAALPDRDPCAECVSRKGTLANSQHHDRERLAQCIRDGEPFLCGHGRDHGRVCGGWLKAAKARSSPALRGGME